MSQLLLSSLLPAKYEPRINTPCSWGKIAENQVITEAVVGIVVVVEVVVIVEVVVEVIVVSKSSNSSSRSNSNSGKSSSDSSVVAPIFNVISLFYMHCISHHSNTFH